MIVIHIGLAKAGSSRLQTVLARLEPELAEHDVHYPQIGRVGVAHHPLGRPLADGDSSAPRSCGRSCAHFATPDRTVVISSESFETLDPRAGPRDGRRATKSAWWPTLRPATARIPSLLQPEHQVRLQPGRLRLLLRPDGARPSVPGGSRARWPRAGRPSSGARTSGSGPWIPEVLTGGTAGERLPELVGAPGSVGWTSRTTTATTSRRRGRPSSRCGRSTGRVRGPAARGDPQRPRFLGLRAACPAGSTERRSGSVDRTGSLPVSCSADVAGRRPQP